jgi:hypothetical protein
MITIGVAVLLVAGAISVLYALSFCMVVLVEHMLRYRRKRRAYAVLTRRLHELLADAGHPPVRRGQGGRHRLRTGRRANTGSRADTTTRPGAVEEPHNQEHDKDYDEEYDDDVPYGRHSTGARYFPVDSVRGPGPRTVIVRSAGRRVQDAVEEDVECPPGALIAAAGE